MPDCEKRSLRVLSKNCTTSKISVHRDAAPAAAADAHTKGAFHTAEVHGYPAKYNKECKNYCRTK